MGTVGEPINPEAWVWYYQGDRRRALPGRRHVVADRDRRHHDQRAAGRDHAQAGQRDVPAAGHRRPASSTTRASRSVSPAAAISCSSGRGRRCCAASGAIPSATATPTGAASRASTSRATAPSATTRVTSGCSAASTTSCSCRVTTSPRPRSSRRSSTIPSVAEAAVVGKADDTTGQAIAAFVTLRAGIEPRDELVERAARPRRRADRPDREAEDDPVHRGAAEDPVGQDHAPAPARRGRGPGARRHDHARRPGGRRRHQVALPRRRADRRLQP